MINHTVSPTSIAPGIWLGFTLTLFFMGASTAQAGNIVMFNTAYADGQQDARNAGGENSSYSLSTSASVTDLYFHGDGSQFVGTYSAVADVFASFASGNLLLGFSEHLDAAGGVYGGNGLWSSTYGSVSVTDSFTIVGDYSGILAQYGNKAIVTFHVNGHGAGSLLGGSDNAFQSGSLRFDVNAQFLDMNLDGTTGDYGSISGYLSGETDLFNGKATYSAGLQWNTTINAGFWDSFYDHTSALSSITFPDGTTPESHGLEIVFDSGITSPNLIVPEPSAFALMGAGVVGLLGGLWRQRSRRLHF